MKQIESRHALALVLVLASLCASGCATLIGQVRYNAADARFALDKPAGPTLTQSAKQTLKAYRISERLSIDQVERLADELQRGATPELIYAYVETSYLLARRLEKTRQRLAKQLYLSTALYAYHFLFNPALAKEKNDSIFAGETNDVALIYNGACEHYLKLALSEPSPNGNDEFPFRQNQIYASNGESEVSRVFFTIKPGAWQPEEYAAFDLVSNCKTNALSYSCKTEGLGAALVAKRRADPSIHRIEEKYYPSEICFPATAIIRPNPFQPLGTIPALETEANPTNKDAVESDAILEIHDSLHETSIVINGRAIPLIADYTTPLAFYLATTERQTSKAGRLGLLKPDKFLEKISDDDVTRERSLQGLYMVEPYDPNKIPIIMTHGLGSTPTTWMEMYNALRNASNLQIAYQFMFFFYPTGQPFWVSAAMMRAQLRDFLATVDPNRDALALDHIVLIGHSMGGLISRMQVQESGDRVWRLISDEPFDSVTLDPETREDLRSWFFFSPNSSVRRVITIATPFEGSEFSNSFTQWLAEQAITFPKTVSRALSSSIAKESKGIYNSTLLTTRTSVDALSPKCPIFKALDECSIPDTVALNNIVGVVPAIEKRPIRAKKSDGVVDFESAHRDDVESEREAPASHTSVHAHPTAILEVKEILNRHLIRTYAEIAAKERTKKGNEFRPRAFDDSNAPNAIETNEETLSPPLPPEFSGYLRRDENDATNADDSRPLPEAFAPRDDRRSAQLR